MTDETRLPADPSLEPTGLHALGPAVGGTLGGFHLVRELGRGGMGVVYEAEDVALHRRVAVKCLLPHLADEAFRSRFLREARAAAALRDDHVVTVHQVGREGDTPFLVMEFLEGETLAALLDRRGFLPPADAVRIAREVALGLAAAHAKGIVHRDVKPENVWLGIPAGRAKVLDFGLARPADGPTLTAPGTVAGTVGYMAPEQIYGGPLDGRTDLYALGCLLYRMAWGDLPHRGENTLAHLDAVVNTDAPDLSAVGRRLPAPLADLLRRLLARNPDDRPADAAGVAAELAAIGAAVSPAGPPAAAPTRAWTPARRHRPAGLWVGVAAVVVAAIVGAASLAGRFARTPDAAPPPAAAGPPAPAGEPIRIGVLHSATGMFKDNETPMREAIHFAVAEVNAAGGVLGRPVEAVDADPRSTEGEYARLAERLVTADGVAAVFGCWTTASRRRVAEVCGRHGNLLVYSVLGEGLEEHPNVVYAGGAPNQQLHEAVEYARSRVNGLGKAKFFLVGSGYDLYSHAAHAMLADEITHTGGAVVGNVLAPLGGMDFGPVAADVRKSGADVVLNTADGEGVVRFAAALDAAGVSPKDVPTVWLGVGEDELGAADLPLRVGDYAVAPYFETLDTPANKAFVRRFRDKYPSRRRVGDPAAGAYAAVHLWKRAVERAGTADPAAVREAFRGVTFDAPEGPVRIDPVNLYAWRPARVGRLEADAGGAVVYKMVLDGGPLRPVPYPPPHDKAGWDAFADRLYKEWGGRTNRAGAGGKP